jgi:GT2 family glycosyltransferase
MSTSDAFMNTAGAKHMPQTLVDVSVIIVNWNTWPLLQDCLVSVFADLDHGRMTGEVIVVDNGSTDGSAAMIAETFPRVRLIRNPENRGLAEGMNQGIAQAGGRNVLFLNSDTVVRRGATAAMMGRLEADAKLAGVAPKLLNSDGTIQRSCWPFPMKALLGNTFGLYRLGVLDDYRAWDHRYDRQVDWVSSAALMVPRRVLDHVGLFDPRFFYGVDVDWAHRATRAGYRFLSLADAEVVHLGGGSQRSEETPSIAHGPDVHSRYFRKHHGVPGLLLFRGLLIVGSVPRLLLWEVAHLLRISREADQRRVMFRRYLSSALRFRG